MSFCYQENTHFSQAAQCSRENFWKEIKKNSTRWKIESRRSILQAVAKQDKAAIKKWLENEDFQKFLAKKRHAKKEAARKKFFEKSDEEQLLAFAQELKDNLTAFIFSCREFDENVTAKGVPFRHRRLAGCHLNGLVMLDIDHVENPMEVWEKLQQNEALMALTKMVHITSSKKGVRIVFAGNAKIGNLADNQIWFVNALGGYKPDASCIDATRNSFAPLEEDILYIDDSIFDYYDEEFDKKYTADYRAKKTQPLHYKFPVSDGADGSSNPETAAVAHQDGQLCADQSREVDDHEVEIKWREYDIQCIIDKRYSAKLPCAADSNRHNESLKLASDLLVLFDGDRKLVQRILERQSWVQEIIEERDENVAQTVASAAERMADREKKYLTQCPSKAMQEAISQACGQTWKQITQGETTDTATIDEEEIEQWLWDWGEKIEALFPYYPALQDACKGLKRNQYPAALVVSGALMMTLMTRCTYRFYHRPSKLRRLNASALIIGDPASGKSFATRLYEFLAAPIVAADKAGKDTINRYREEMKTKGANKEKPKKPKVVVRVHPSRTSNAQFIQDMVNAVENVDGTDMQLHMLTFDTELDNTLSVQKGGSWIDKQNLELKAFHNEEDGQAYSNMDSIMQDFNVTWNYVYTGTPMALKKKVNEQNFGSGLATRLTCIPLPSTHFEMMDLDEEVDEDSDNRLLEWAKKLDKTKGELSIKRIVRTMYDWTARRMADAKDNESKADEMLLKRCAYHGINYSVPFIVMRHWGELHQEGDYWCGEFETDEIDDRLAELIVNIQFACQRHYFGSLAEKYFDDKLRDAATNRRHHQKTIEEYNKLPEEFSIDDVARIFHINIYTARTRVRRLLEDNAIEKCGEYMDNKACKHRYKKKATLVC
jgi:hypothetical protein